MSGPLVIRDLPGIADLEIDLVFRRNDYDGVQEDLAGAAAMKLFGVALADLDQLYERHVDLLTSYEMADDETVAAMLTIGIDFSDARGHPLRCTLLLAGPAEVAAKGLAGYMPGSDKASLDRITANLERDRDAFIANKRRAAGWKRPKEGTR